MGLPPQLHQFFEMRAVRQFHARERGLDCFTVLSTVVEFFAAKLRNSGNAARIGFVPSTYEKQAVQRCENIRNSLGLNYKSAALNQLSYAGVPIRKLFSAS